MIPWLETREKRDWQEDVSTCQAGVLRYKRAGASSRIAGAISRAIADCSPID